VDSFFTTRQEVKGQCFVTVNVQKEIHPRLLHGIQDMEDFGRVLYRRSGIVWRIEPFAIQIRPHGIGAQVSADRAVGAHVGDNVKGVVL
jgi:hypothetical protein